MDDTANRAELARWNWKARQAREALVETFADHGRQLAGEWCDFEESSRTTREVEALGGSHERIIQRWLAKDQFAAVARSCDTATLRIERLVALIMDVPEAAWLEVSIGVVQSDLIPSAVEWMTDGFILYSPSSSSLLSIDVVQTAEVSLIETTLVGDGLADLGMYLRSYGPDPLPIVNP